MVPQIRYVQIRNYKSLANVDVRLGPLTMLVGPNGSGKSNFIDALAFVGECMASGVDHALSHRGGFDGLVYRGAGDSARIGIRLGLVLADNTSSEYAFDLAERSSKGFRVAHERCIVWHRRGKESRFEIRNGSFETPVPGIRPQIAPDRLAIAAASATEEFRPVYDFLNAMRFYSVSPRRMSELFSHESGDYLERDGRNAASVLRRLVEHGPTFHYERVCRLLSQVAEGIESVEPHDVGGTETLRFRQRASRDEVWTFGTSAMSDGTLRALGLLLAVYQPGDVSLLGIEEPESTVHPAVAELVIEVLMDAAQQRQVLVTTHSPDLLDFKELDDRQIRAVVMEGGSSLVAPVAPFTREAIRERLYSPGELLRNGELCGDLDAAREAARRLELFGPPLELLREGGDEASDRSDR